MPALSRTMKQILEGLAYADLAEMQPIGDKYRALANDTPTANPPSVGAPQAASQPAPRRRIGLFVGPFAPRPVFDYAADSCERLDAELVVLTFLGKAEAGALIDGFIRDTGPLPHGVHIEALTGDPERALRRVLGRGLRLDFLVCDEQGYLGHQILATETAAELPVVMVAAPRKPRPGDTRTAPSGTALPSAG
ncbi:hypothetical protein [Thioalkalivibrio sp. ALMg3]|uniref:hypothetical protein n=1 Tax=Thioalkalivibrio sp. ALMg3 TaxID=1158163 RepID=UPI00037A688B|nr:hypothetical protein [Thioalkalivibrio sp. ALMg3]